MSSRGRGAWALVVIVLASWLVAALAAAVGLAPRAGSASAQPLALVNTAGSGSTTGSDGTDGPVVVLGVPGLTWDLVDATTTPHLHSLAEEGGTAALVLRGTHEVTCAADAWLTLGAGQRAATRVEGCGDAAFEATPFNDRPTPVLVEDIVTEQGDGAVVDPAEWDEWRRAADGRHLTAQLGTLAAALEESGSCVAAHDPLTVIGAADPEGRATAYLPGAEGVLTDEPGGCRVHLLATPPVTEADGVPQQTEPALEQVDHAAGDLVDGLPEGSTLVVAGMGHTLDRATAMALIVRPALTVRPAAGGDSGGAALTSGSTQQRGLVQLTDLTPTLLSLAGADVPEGVAGQQVGVLPVEGDHAARAADLANAVSEAKRLPVWVFGAIAAVFVPLLGLALVLLRGRFVAVLGTFAMAVPVATWLAGLVPWWRADQPGVVLTLTVAAAAALVAALAWAGPWRREPLAPAAVVAAVTLVVIGVDTLWSSRLGLVSILGLQPVTAGRFYGQGNVGFGVMLGAFVVLAGAVTTWLAGRRTGAAAAVLLLGAGLTIHNGAPWGGADFGGVPALVVATGLLVLAALGLRWSASRLVLLAVLGVAVAALVMVLDWLRGPGQRTHLGDFVQRVLDGQALGIVTRKLDQSLGILISYPISWLAVLALVLVAVVVVRRPAWTSALWRHEGVRPAALAGLVATVLAWALNDSGIAAAALALTLLIAAAVTVLGRCLGDAAEGLRLPWRRPSSA